MMIYTLLCPRFIDGDFPVMDYVFHAERDDEIFLLYTRIRIFFSPNSMIFIFVYIQLKQYVKITKTEFQTHHFFFL